MLAKDEINKIIRRDRNKYKLSVNVFNYVRIRIYVNVFRWTSQNLYCSALENVWEYVLECRNILEKDAHT